MLSVAILKPSGRHLQLFGVVSDSICIYMGSTLTWFQTTNLFKRYTHQNLSHLLELNVGFCAFSHISFEWCMSLEEKTSLTLLPG